MIAATSDIRDPYIQVFARFVIAWDEIHRGRIVQARERAQELVAVGREMNDPRSLGFGIQIQAWIALIGDDYVAALNLAETASSLARVAYDRESMKNIINAVPVLLRRPGAYQTLRDWMLECAENGWGYYLTAVDGVWGVALVLHGDIGGGIAWIEKCIRKREQDGYRLSADWYRLFLCEIYLEIISGKDRPSASVLARNAPTLIAVTLTARRRIVNLVERVRQNPQLDPDGHFVGRAEMILGLLYKAKKKRVLAIQRLTEARRIASQFGPTPMLAKIEAALAELR